MDRSVTRWATLRSASLTARKPTRETPRAAAALAEPVPLTGDLSRTMIRPRRSSATMQLVIPMIRSGTSWHRYVELQTPGACGFLGRAVLVVDTIRSNSSAPEARVRTAAIFFELMPVCLTETRDLRVRPPNKTIDRLHLVEFVQAIWPEI